MTEGPCRSYSIIESMWQWQWYQHAIYKHAISRSIQHWQQVYLLVFLGTKARVIPDPIKRLNALDTSPASFPLHIAASVSSTLAWQRNSTVLMPKNIQLMDGQIERNLAEWRIMCRLHIIIWVQMWMVCMEHILQRTTEGRDGCFSRNVRAQTKSHGQNTPFSALSTWNHVIRDAATLTANERICSKWISRKPNGDISLKK